MKQLFLGVSIILSLATYAQKDELKTLKKIYEKEQITEEELKTYKEASDKLSSVASSESDKVYAKFYKTIFPALEFASKGENQSDSDKTKFFNPDFLAAYGSILDNTLEFEKKSGKKILTDYIIKEKAEFRDFLYASGSKLFDDKKYREASLMFHNLYVFDPKHEGLALENSAQLAVQAQDYLLAEKFYEDLRDSDYLKNGVNYYATNVANGKEELYPSEEDRARMISLKIAEKPRNVKMDSKKPDVYRMLALIALQNKDIEKTKKALQEAKALNPNDQELIDGEFQLYFDLAYNYLKGEAAIVDEINKNLESKDKAKFDELMGKRKSLFKSSLPYLEKAHQLKPTDANTKNILKSAYEVLDMKDKLATIK